MQFQLTKANRVKGTLIDEKPIMMYDFNHGTIDAYSEETGYTNITNEGWRF